MPRMSKKRKEEWSFFLNDRNRITYNDLCRRCCNGCKQSFRTMVIDCPRYCSKRAKQLDDPTKLPRGPNRTDSSTQPDQKGRDG